MFEGIKKKLKNKLKHQGSKQPSHEERQFFFPEETQPHEATWLQWPHKYTYGKQHQQKLEPIFVEIAQALAPGQIVRIITYNQDHKNYVQSILKDITNIQYYVYETDDIWVRDNGPVFIREKKSRKLFISHWGFNGWGQKVKYSKCERRYHKKQLMIQNFKEQI